MSNEKEYADEIEEGTRRGITFSEKTIKTEIEKRNLNASELMIILIEKGLLIPQSPTDEEYLKYLFN